MKEKTKNKKTQKFNPDKQCGACGKVIEGKKYYLFAEVDGVIVNQCLDTRYFCEDCVQNNKVGVIEESD